MIKAGAERHLGAHIASIQITQEVSCKGASKTTKKDENEVSDKHEKIDLHDLLHLILFEHPFELF